jgi:hypothetical protein
MIREETILKTVAIVEEAYGIPIKMLPPEKMDTPGAGGEADMNTETIQVITGPWRTQGGLASTLLHEVAHILCKRAGIYKDFHTTKHQSYLTDEQLWAIISTAWKAECYVERMAKAMLQELFPGCLYHFSYNRRKIEKGWFDENWLADFKRELRRRKLRRIDKEKRLEQK